MFNFLIFCVLIAPYPGSLRKGYLSLWLCNPSITLGGIRNPQVIRNCYTSVQRYLKWVVIPCLQQEH